MNSENFKIFLGISLLLDMSFANIFPPSVLCCPSLSHSFLFFFPKLFSIWYGPIWSTVPFMDYAFCGKSCCLLLDLKFFSYFFVYKHFIVLCFAHKSMLCFELDFVEGIISCNRRIRMIWADFRVFRNLCLWRLCS